MPRPSVIPKITAELSRYLNECQAAFDAQPDDSRKPTLPLTPDSKINVSALAEAIKLTHGQRKYIYERAELTQLVNSACNAQGVMPIGSRVTLSATENALKEHLGKKTKATQEISQSVVVVDYALQQALDKIKQLSADIEALTIKNIRLRAQVKSIREGMYIEVKE